MWTHVYSSELLLLECHRAIDRSRLLQQIGDKERAELETRLGEVTDRLDLIPVTKEIMTRAGGSFPTVVATLDALHVASALATRGGNPKLSTVATHDLQMARAAASLGFEVIG